MKKIVWLIILLFGVSAVFAQDETAPIVAKDLKYQDWTYSKTDIDNSINLRSFAKGKKLVLVVYFAPWCHNSKHQAPFIQKLHEKYAEHGLGIIGVGEYAVVEDMKWFTGFYKITFPVVQESDSKLDREYTLHYKYRKDLEDERKWGTPLNIFIEPENLTEKGDTLTKKVSMAFGELDEVESEILIREKLGLPPEHVKAVNADKTVEICDEEKPPVFKKP